LRYRADKQTDRQTNNGENPTPAIVVGVGKYSDHGLVSFRYYVDNHVIFVKNS